jgi:hypothetical protein
MPAPVDLDDIIQPFMMSWDPEGGTYEGVTLEQYQAEQQYACDNYGMCDFVGDTAGANTILDLQDWNDAWSQYITPYDYDELARIKDRNDLGHAAILHNEIDSLTTLATGLGMTGLDSSYANNMVNQSLNKIANALYSADVAALQSIGNSFASYESDVYSELGNLAMLGAFETDQNEISQGVFDYSETQGFGGPEYTFGDELPSWASATQAYFMNPNQVVGCTDIWDSNYNPQANVSSAEACAGDWGGSGGGNAPPGTGDDIQDCLDQGGCPYTDNFGIFHCYDFPGGGCP